MVTITKKELEIDNELKNKIEFICSFCNTIFLLLSMVILEKLKK